VNYRSICDLSRDLLTWELPADIEAIVGIPRSGMLVAGMLALHRNLPYTDLDGFLAGRMLATGATKNVEENLDRFLERRRKVLIVDDSCASGAEMRWVRQTISEAGLDHDLYFAVVYMNPGREREVDFYRRLLPWPRLFEWNVLHSPTATGGCWDIDGVLCRDPTPEENDDGPRYLQFISEVPVRVRPSLPLGWIVTSRLEKYREPTEAWLARNGIACDHLVMLDLPDKETRVAANCHASFKAEVYKGAPADIFIESSQRQAVEIARLSGKCVISFETQECVLPSAAAQIKHECRDLMTVVTLRARSRVRRVYEACMGPRDNRRGGARSRASGR